MLSLYMNKITDAGAEGLSVGLKKNATLTELGLGINIHLDSG